MEAEEFQEVEILWPYSNAEGDDRANKHRSTQPREISSKSKGGGLSHSWTQGMAALDIADYDVDSDKGWKAMPPHVLIARRREAEKMAFSVQVGNGRTLKGRDQRQVRDAVHRMTGFLER